MTKDAELVWYRSAEPGADAHYCAVWRDGERTRVASVCGWASKYPFILGDTGNTPLCAKCHTMFLSKSAIVFAMPSGAKVEVRAARK